MAPSLTLTRSFISIIVPGAVAVAPWALLGIDTFSEIAHIYRDYVLPSQVLMFVIVVVVGAAIEGAGTYLEKYWDDKKDYNPCSWNESFVDKEWYDYLARQFGDGEPVGYRYLSRKITTFYFELGMSLSTCIGTVAILMLLVNHNASTVAVDAVLIFSGAVIYLFYNLAQDTHQVLCRTRHKVNVRLDARDSTAKQCA